MCRPANNGAKMRAKMRVKSRRSPAGGRLLQRAAHPQYIMLHRYGHALTYRIGTRH
jgi:hypothetical protein